MTEPNRAGGLSERQPSTHAHTDPAAPHKPAAHAAGRGTCKGGGSHSAWCGHLCDSVALQGLWGTGKQQQQLESDVMGTPSLIVFHLQEGRRWAGPRSVCGYCRDKQPALRLLCLDWSVHTFACHRQINARLARG